MRTLSARILLGFAALTVTFGVIAATVVVNMRVVEREIRVLHLGYVPLQPLPRELEHRQKDLTDYLDTGFRDDPHELVTTRALRDRAVKGFREALGAAERTPGIREHEFDGVHRRLDTVQAEIEAATPLYARLNKFQSRSAREPTTDEDDALAKLSFAERKIGKDALEIVQVLEKNMNDNASQLEDNEHKLRLATIYFGLTAVVLGLLITIWVVITLRPLHQLREAARRVAAGDYGKRIDERGPTEVKDLARELNSMASAVEERERELVRSERLAAIGKMAAMITHEVRNPLSSIGLNTELLQEELGDDRASDDAKQLCRAIHREVDRLTAITEEYLAFARLPKPKIARESVNALAGQLAEFVREDLAAKQVQLVLELAGGEPIALIDAAQIRQCLINLVRNAADAVIAKGGGRVALRTRKQDARVVIEVEDEGTGIAPDVQARMFDPFFSTKEGGSGLGLALTQQIVKDHGGDLAVDSTVGRGTTFTVSVPAA
jgi:signal transduction histidine kinase